MAKILIVDDHGDSLTAMSLLLQLENYAVVGAATGAETLRLIEAERPDLVLLDLYLPDISGAEICEILEREGAFRMTENHGLFTCRRRGL